MSENKNFLGIIPPITFSRPTYEDLMNNTELDVFIKKNCNIFDSEEGEKRRKRVLEKLNFIVKEWAIEIGKERNIDPNRYFNGGGIQLRIFGSMKLNVHNQDSDIDVLCVAPSFITKKDFFSTFCQRLISRTDIDAFSSIPEAYTPVLKFSMDGQSVDMVFSSLQFSTLPMDLDILDLKCLTDLDEVSVRSLNGARVAEWILNLVPDKKTYCATLRIIKYWARQRGIYSNVLGFLGGVNFAIMVALICQLFANACPYTLINKFFAIYARWRWPHPVLLKEFEDLKLTDSDGKELPVWNPKLNYKDSLHLMPIITPAYPSMNSAYNVTKPQFRYIQEEIYRGCLFFQNHQGQSGFPWDKLFESSTVEFFQKYPKYIQIDIMAPTANEHRSWFGWIESRIRLLILSLEQPPVIFCHPIANCFHRSPLYNDIGKDESEKELNTETTKESGEHSDEFNIDENSSENVPSTPERAHFSNDASVKTPDRDIKSMNSYGDMFISTFFIGLSFQQGVKFADVTFSINEFLSKVNNWSFKKPSMEVNIVTCDHENIPKFVFETKAEPSNVKSCTPKPIRSTRGGSGLEELDTSIDDVSERMEYSTNIGTPQRKETSLYSSNIISSVPLSPQFVGLSSPSNIQSARFMQDNITSEIFSPKLKFGSVSQNFNKANQNNSNSSNSSNPKNSTKSEEADKDQKTNEKKVYHSDISKTNESNRNRNDNNNSSTNNQVQGELADLNGSSYHNFLNKKDKNQMQMPLAIKFGAFPPLPPPFLVQSATDSEYQFQESNNFSNISQVNSNSDHNYIQNPSMTETSPCKQRNENIASQYPLQSNNSITTNKSASTIDYRSLIQSQMNNMNKNNDTKGKFSSNSSNNSLNSSDSGSQNGPTRQINSRRSNNSDSNDVCNRRYHEKPQQVNHNNQETNSRKLNDNRTKNPSNSNLTKKNSSINNYYKNSHDNNDALDQRIQSQSSINVNINGPNAGNVNSNINVAQENGLNFQKKTNNINNHSINSRRNQKSSNSEIIDQSYYNQSNGVPNNSSNYIEAYPSNNHLSYSNKNRNYSEKMHGNNNIYGKPKNINNSEHQMGLSYARIADNNPISSNFNSYENYNRPGKPSQNGNNNKIGQNKNFVSKPSSNGGGYHYMVDPRLQMKNSNFMDINDTSGQIYFISNQGNLISIPQGSIIGREHMNYYYNGSPNLFGMNNSNGLISGSPSNPGNGPKNGMPSNKRSTKTPVKRYTYDKDSNSSNQSLGEKTLIGDPYLATKDYIDEQDILKEKFCEN